VGNLKRNLQSAIAVLLNGQLLPKMVKQPFRGIGKADSSFCKNIGDISINGSSGGVGHFAVQIAKVCGAHVTAVCSSRNVDFVMALGADRVIAYDKGGIDSLDGTFDLVLDTHGNLTYADYKRWGKRGVMVGFMTVGNLFGLSLRKALGRFPLALVNAEANATDLETLASLIKDGKVRVHLDRTYSYREIPEAIRYIEAMRTRGKVAMTWGE